MPQLPTLSNRASLPAMSLPQLSGADFGAQGFQQIAQVGGVFQQIQDTYDRSEAGRASSELSAQIDGIVKTNKQTIGNPDEFEKTTQQQIDTAHDQALGTLTSARSKEMFKGVIADNLMKAKYGIKYDAFEKKIKIAKDNFAIEEQDLMNAAASEDPQIATEAKSKYSRRLGELSAEGVLDGTEHKVKIRTFLEKAATTRANTLTEVNPPSALKYLASAEAAESIPIDKRLTLVRSANAAYRSGIQDQKQALELQQRNANLELQQMFDAGATDQAITAKLREHTANGVYDFTERHAIEEKIRNKEVKDTGVQIQNRLKLESDFYAKTPSPGRVAEFRQRAAAMMTSGQLGLEGQVRVQTELTNASKWLLSEARSEASAGRAAVAFDKAMAKKDEPKAPEHAVQEYLAGAFSPTPKHAMQNPIGDHKNAVAEYYKRVVGGENRVLVAKDIVKRREETNKNRPPKMSTDDAASLKAVKELMEQAARELRYNNGR